MLKELASKYGELRRILSDMDGVLVAYSGGVDSTLLLRVALETLGDRVLAVTAISETYPTHEVEEAVRLAKDMGARVRTIETGELDSEQFASNPPERCFYCKTELFGKLAEIARAESIPVIADGSNADDSADYRPGARAASVFAVRSPLREAGFTKADVRDLSRELGLPTWNKPSSACLASRFPYGDRISREALKKVGDAEKVLRDLGLRQVRVRHHGETARIEVELEDLPIVVGAGNRERIVAAFHEIGYLYVTLDLDGYRSGSMNAPLGQGPARQTKTPSRD